MGDSLKIPVSEIIAEAHRVGYLDVNEDVLQRLRVANLIGSTKRLGRGQGSAFTSKQAVQVAHVLRLRAQLGKNPDHAEIAFFMVANGFGYAPSDKIAWYIESRLKSFIVAGQRGISRTGTGRRRRSFQRVPEDGFARIVGRQWLRAFELPPSPQRTEVKGLLENALAILFGVVYLDNPLSRYRSRLRKIFFILMMDPNDVDEEFERQYLWIEKLEKFLSPKQLEGSLMDAIYRSLTSDPRIVQVAARDSALMYHLMFDALADIPDVPHTVVRPSNAMLIERQTRGMLPAFAALSIKLQLEGHTQMLERLRSGDTFDLRQKVNSLFQAGIANYQSIVEAE